MLNYRYHLQKYRTIADKHTCPSCGRKRCFKLYVDDNNQPLNDRVGYCDHISSCGYHYPPRQYFHDHPQSKPPSAPHVGTTVSQRASSPLLQKKAPVLVASHNNPASTTGVPPTWGAEGGSSGGSPSTLPVSLVERSMASVYYPSDLTRFLMTLFGAATVQRLIDDYRVGRTSNGRTIFWQIDIEGRVRTGLIMRYRPDGHRDHNAHDAFNWAHAIMAKRGEVADYNLRQCLFGEHLLAARPTAPVALVEGAKSALIASGVMPQYVWVATCGKNQFKPEVLAPLRGRDVTVFPDVDGYAAWLAAAQHMKAALQCRSLDVSSYLERHATPEQRLAHIDLADLLVEMLRRDAPLNEGEVYFRDLLARPDAHRLLASLALLPV